MPAAGSSSVQSRRKADVVIVNYGTAELSADAVRSVLTHAAEDVQIHLVDNASPTGDAAVFKRLHQSESWGGRVTLYLEAENAGFGRGNNVVLDKLLHTPDAPDYVLLLNPDASLTNDAVGILSQFLDAHPKAGAAGACITSPEGEKVTAAFRFPDAGVSFVSTAAFGPLIKLAPNKTLWLPPDLPTGPVDWVAGAAVMLRLEALREVGTFDPDFFLYFEEVELMWRLAQGGWGCWFVEEARVAHYEGAATDVRSGDDARKPKPDYWYRSQMLYDAKTATRIGAPLRAAARYAGALTHAAVRALRGRGPELPTGYLKTYPRKVIAPLAATVFLGERPDAPPATPALPSRAQRDIDSGGTLSDDINNGLHNNNPEGISFRALVAEDYRTHGSNLLSQGFWVLFWHRFGNWRMDLRPRLLRVPFSVLYKIGAKLVEWSTGTFLPYTVVVGRRVRLEYFGSMILVARAVGDDVTIRQNTTFGITSVGKKTKRPTIGDRVDIGAGVVVLGDVKVDADTVIGANAVVNRSHPAGVIVAGVPAKVIGSNTKTPIRSVS